MTTNFATENLCALLDEIADTEGIAKAVEAAQRHANAGRVYAGVWLAQRGMDATVKRTAVQPIAKGIRTPDYEGLEKMARDHKLGKSATEQLDDLTAAYAVEKGVDRPTARVAVLKTAEGKRLYAESIGRAPVAPAPEPEQLTKSASEYEADLAAFAKARGLRLADAMKTAEGRELYNQARRAERGAR